MVRRLPEGRAVAEVGAVARPDLARWRGDGHVALEVGVVPRRRQIEEREHRQRPAAARGDGVHDAVAVGAVGGPLVGLVGRAAAAQAVLLPAPARVRAREWVLRRKGHCARARAC